MVRNRLHEGQCLDMTGVGCPGFAALYAGLRHEAVYR
ncbi:hypothetical protein FB481_109153 [Pseudomonas sp. AG1028]|nr:hypothetical protein FB481_109153 [Pseudomonas sp. AG1028]